jgi:NhaP-type Na+/H+ and K+/H+ antiporter
LKKFVRNKLVLKNPNAKEGLKRSFSKRSENQDDEVVKKSINQKDDSVQLSTSFESLSPQLIPRQSGLIKDERISRFQSEDREDAVDSSNVIVRRKNKNKKSESSRSESSRSESSRSDQLSLFEIDQISLDVTDFQINLRSVRNIESVKPERIKYTRRKKD